MVPGCPEGRETGYTLCGIRHLCRSAKSQYCIGRSTARQRVGCGKSFRGDCCAASRRGGDLRKGQQLCRIGPESRRCSRSWTRCRKRSPQSAGSNPGSGETARVTPENRDELMRAVALHAEGYRQLSTADAVWEGSSDAVLHGVRSLDEMAAYTSRALAARPK
jgi:hypothetical protein